MNFQQYLKDNSKTIIIVAILILTITAGIIAAKLLSSQEILSNNVGNNNIDQNNINTSIINPGNNSGTSSTEEKNDTDNDYINDDDEIDIYKTDPKKTDTDGDEINDYDEINTYKTNPNKEDTDEDGIKDGAEIVTYKTNPNKTDTDEDGIKDSVEIVIYKTDPNKADTDEDGLKDSVEIVIYKTDPNKEDTDQDGIKDAVEILICKTNPCNADTDGDTISDIDEVNIYKTNPSEADSDGDTLKDNEEINNHYTNPNNIDSDGDGINDGDEINTYNTNPGNPDTDGDEISDNDEINNHKTNPCEADTDKDGLKDNVEINNFKTNPCSSDTDGDGLLDGKAQYVNNKKIAPIDPEPLKVNGVQGIWKKQIEIENKQNIPSYLTTFYEYNSTENEIKKLEDIDWKKLNNSDNLFEELLKLPILKEIASKTLRFRLDNGGTVLHSQTNEDLYEYIISEAKANLSNNQYFVFKKAINFLKIEENLETWQKQFGFNKIYDEIFRTATNNNMRSEQIFFEDSSRSDYVLWLWRGDYLALGSGAEMGLYKKNISSGSANSSSVEHWDAVNFKVPMTLNLYNYHNRNNIEHIYSWAPEKEQWWITGFNTEYPDVDVTKQVLLGTVNLSKHQDMYNSMKKEISNNSKMKDFVIFDDTDSTVWICWYEK